MERNFFTKFSMRWRVEVGSGLDYHSVRPYQKIKKIMYNYYKIQYEMKGGGR